MHNIVEIGDNRKRKSNTVTDYNTIKCGVDIMNQKVRQYTVWAGTRRWPVAVFYNFIDMAAMNAHVLYHVCTGVKQRRVDFLAQLATELAEQFMRERMVDKEQLLWQQPATPHPGKRAKCQVTFQCKKNNATLRCVACFKYTSQTYCREKYTDLASINNLKEMMKLRNTLKMETANQAWIGLQRGKTFYRDGDTYRNWKKKDTNTKSYISINKHKTWRDAQTYCRQNYLDLVSVRNQNQNEKIRNIIKNSSSSGFWIGLFNDSWMWSDQSNSSFRYWSSNKPSKDLNYTAVNVSDQLYWSDVICTEKFPLICNKKKLILIKQNLTWWEALNYEHVWLGLRYDCIQRIWFWVFGSMICYQDWAPGNRMWNTDCSQEKRSGAVQSGEKQQWIDLPESSQLHFICSTMPGHSQLNLGTASGGSSR
ncbi:uncharacterized protein LOC128506371 [Clarias gariepinus]|uniref:uncharacterized protein LOC128506371 n=1 Tax=Clarias gariepinus TaxID=13013 RepID=UPI00234C4E69|nr:uncharacterized protein LOC128506371 [Clarias gariepinus]